MKLFQLSWLFGEQMREVVQKGFFATVARTFGIFLNFILSIWLARRLGADGVGVYSLSLAVITIGSVIGALGLRQACIRYVSTEAVEERWENISALYVRAFWLVFGVSLLFVLLIVMSADFLAVHLFKSAELKLVLQWMSFSIIPASLIQLVAGFLEGVRWVLFSAIVEGIVSPLTMGIIFLFIGREIVIVQVAQGHVVSMLIACLLGYVLWLSVRRQPKAEIINFEFRPILRSAMPLLWIALMMEIRSRIDIILLGFYQSQTVVGVFANATRPVKLMGFLLVAVEGILAPKFAALYAQRQIAQLDQLAKNSVKLMFLIATLPILLFVFFPQSILGVFGPEFIAGSNIMSILAVGKYYQMITGPNALLLTMSGHAKDVRNMVIGGTLLNILLILIFAHYWSGEGVATATALTIILQDTLGVYYVYRRLGIKLWVIW